MHRAQGSDGTDCLRNEDCQSGVCSQLKCVPGPPVLELEAGPEAGADGAADGAPGPAPDSSVAPPADATTSRDANGADAVVGDDGPVVPMEAAPDAIDEGPAPGVQRAKSPTPPPTLAKMPERAARRSQMS